MFKRMTLILVSCLGVSITALAGMPGNPVTLPTGVVLNAPDSDSAWTFGIQALYAWSASSPFNYAQITNPSDLSSQARNHAVSDADGWGEEADITYHFAGSSRDLMLAYTHLGLDGSDTLTTTAPNTISGFSADQAKGTNDFNHNALDLVLGQQLLVGDRIVLHPFLGLRYADIDQDATANIQQTETHTTFKDDNLHSDFDGVGPRLGMDTRVIMGKGFSVVGTLGSSLLVGQASSKYSVTTQGFAAPLNSTPTQVYKPNESTEVLPELDAKLGLDYTPHVLNPDMAWGFQLGYEWTQYFGALQNDGLDTAIVNSDESVNDFAYHGPYLRIQASFR